VSDLSKLAKFAKKEFRDGYLQTAVRGGIAYQIQALREKFNLTQTAFAEKLGKKQSVISRLEDSEYGKVSVQTLLDIASSLDVALLVRFVSYPEFLKNTKNMSDEALKPPTIFESLFNETRWQPKSGSVSQSTDMTSQLNTFIDQIDTRVASKKPDYEGLASFYERIIARPQTNSAEQFALSTASHNYTVNDNGPQAMRAYLGEAIQ